MNNVPNPFLPDLWYSPSDVLLRASEVFVWSKIRLYPPSLDIGCGDGRMSIRLYPHLKIDIGIDIEKSNIKEATKLKFYRETIQADATHLPFPNKFLNTIISHSTFEHIRNDLLAISEVSRVLKPKGKFMFTVPTPNLLSAIRSRLSSIEVYKLNQRLTHYHYRSTPQWETILNKFGLKLTEWHYYFPSQSVIVWLNLLRLQTTKIYHRELWSYLKDSPYGRLFPSHLISQLLKKYLSTYISTNYSSQGTWQFLIAQKL